MKLTKLKRPLILDIILIALALVVLFLVRHNIRNVITPFVYALVVAYLLNPLVNYLESKKIKRPWAILIVFLSIFAMISLIFMSFVPSLGQEISVFVSDIPNIFKFVETFIQEFRSGEMTIIPEALIEFIDLDSEIAKIGETVRKAFGELSTRLLATTGTLLDIVMTPIIAFYFLKDKKKILASLTKAIDDKKLEAIRKILGDIDRVLGGFIKGQMIVAGFVGVLTGIGCAIIGVPYALTVGMVAGITNIIPYFGPWIGGILPVVLALMHNPILALWVIIWMVIVQQVESSFISPQVMSHSVGLHPLTVIFSVLFFGNMFGILGMIIGVPLMGTLKVLFKYAQEYRKAFHARPET